MKVIATTNKSLYIPINCPDGIKGCEVYHTKLLAQPTEEWLNMYVSEYNRGNIIKSVLVEYTIKSNIPFSIDAPYRDRDYVDIICVNEDNTINISPVKSVWSRDEVYMLIHKYRIEKGVRKDVDKEDCDEWIKSNLK
jgi:hypothetical protein